MNDDSRAMLRLHGHAGVRVEDVRLFLGDLEHAYNSLWLFEASVEVWSDTVRRLERGKWSPWDYLTYGPWREPRSFRARGSAPMIWPPTPDSVASTVSSQDRLVLRAASLSSPGTWDFLGKLNPLEVIRQYLCDRHERKKDASYREAAEKRKLELENSLLETKVLAQQIENAKALGLREQDLAPLLKELIHIPLRRLAAHQDDGTIDLADAIVLERELGKGSRPK